MQLTLEPLADEYVRVLACRRKQGGERWVDVAEEAGRKVSWRQLGLAVAFKDVFGEKR